MRNSKKITRHYRLYLAVALGAAVLWTVSPAQAGTDTDNMAVSATVSDNCTISAGALAFGAYDPADVNASDGADKTGSAVLTIQCTSGAVAKITLGQGANSDTGSTDPVPLRRMVYDTTNFLSYLLYQEGALSTVWGNDAATGKAYSGTGAETATDTVYGSIAKGQNVPSGSYTDTVVATITF